MIKSNQTNEFAKRAHAVPESFIREILKVTTNPDMVSFAGGLPNPKLFPVDELTECSKNVFNKYGMQALQYATTEGHLPLRELISERYKQRYNLEISPEQVLITSGSQQGLDLVSKLIINPGDEILVERPGYLGAIQCFSMFEAKFNEVALEEDGPDIDQLEDVLSKRKNRLFYGIPNYQNPTGTSYNKEKRRKVANILSRFGTLFIEDDPYGEIGFGDEYNLPIYALLPEQTILLGSFSKIIAPGLRLGWMVANFEIIKKLTVLKQASDLHSGNLSQYILCEYLTSYNLNTHIEGIIDQYRHQCEVMLDSLYHHFPFSVKYTRPKGGMFCWLTLPLGITSRELLEAALRENIVFVPGDSFYAGKPDSQTLRLNFSNLDESLMRDALKKLGNMIR